MINAQIQQTMNHSKYYLHILLLSLFICGINSNVSGQEIAPLTKDSLFFYEYLDQVTTNNLEFLAEKCNINIAEAEALRTHISPDPSLDLEAEKEKFTVGIGYSLELGNKRNARINLANSKVDIQKLMLSYYFQDLRSEAAMLFLNTILQQDLLQIQLDSYTYMQKLCESDSLRYLAGEISENNVRQTRLETATLRNEIYEQEAALISAQIKMSQLRGELDTERITPIGKLDISYKTEKLNELIQYGYTYRSDLLIAIKNKEVALHELKLARAERKPDIGISIGFEREWRKFIPKGESLKGGISIPLPFSNINKGSINVAKSKISQTDLNERSVQLQIEAEIKQAWYNLEAQLKKKEQFNTGLLVEAKNILEGMVYKYKRGETNILDVLIARRTYNEIQIAHIKTKYEYITALIDLERSCGIWNIQL